MSISYVDIPILEVARLCGITVYDTSNIEINTKCPFCDDKRKHLYFNTEKNQFYCQRCSEDGNSITLYAKLKNVDNRTAYKQLISGNTLNISSCFSKHMRQPHTEMPIKPLSDRHDVYYDMLSMLTLSLKHKQDLLLRGFNEETIQSNMYRTMPEQYSKQYCKLLFFLSKNHDLSGIPGFYLKNGKWQMYITKGLLIPICNQFGYIQGLQIRRDNAEDDKYRAFSSNFFKNGTKAHSFFHVANWKNSKIAYITEGALKSEIASFLMGGVCVIGITGVNHTTGLDTLISDLGLYEVVEAFDMDKFSKTNVSKALATLNGIVSKTGVNYHHATWDSSYNGLDDYYLALKNQRASA